MDTKDKTYEGDELMLMLILVFKRQKFVYVLSLVQKVF